MLASHCVARAIPCKVGDLLSDSVLSKFIVPFEDPLRHPCEPNAASARARKFVGRLGGAIAELIRSEQNRSGTH